MKWGSIVLITVVGVRTLWHYHGKDVYVYEHVCRLCLGWSESLEGMVVITAATSTWTTLACPLRDAQCSGVPPNSESGLSSSSTSLLGPTALASSMHRFTLNWVHGHLMDVNSRLRERISGHNSARPYTSRLTNHTQMSQVSFNQSNTFRVCTNSHTRARAHTHTLRQNIRVRTRTVATSP